MMDRSIQPKLSGLGQLSCLPPQRWAMENGMPLAVIRTGQVEMVRMDLVFGGGNFHEEMPLQAAVANRMLREGTRRFTAAQIEEKLDYYGAWLSLYVRDECAVVTVFALNKFVAEVWEIMASIVKEATFPEREYKVLMENKMQQYCVNAVNSDYLASRYFDLALLGEKHPAGRGVTVADYIGLEREQVQAYYNRYYNAANCRIYLSGMVTDSVLEATRKVFGTELWGEGTLKAGYKLVKPMPAGEKRVFVSRTDSMQNSLRMGELTIGYGHPDYMGLKMLTDLLGGYFGSRLMKNIREEKGYTYDISAQLVNRPGTGMLVIASEADAAYTEAIVHEVKHEMEVLQQQPVDEGELTMLKNYLFGRLCRRLEGGMALADVWIALDVHGLGDDFYERMNAVRADITAGQLRDLACKYLHPQLLMEVVVGEKNANKV